MQKNINIFQLTTSRKHVYYNIDPLKPHFYIVKQGFTGGTHYFSYFYLKTWILWVLIRSEAVLTNAHSLCFEQKFEKYQNFLSENFHFLVVKFSVYLNRHIFVMKLPYLELCLQHMFSWRYEKNISTVLLKNILLTQSYGLHESH